MSNDLSASAQRVQAELEKHGIDCQVQEMNQTTRSAADAARAVGCTVGQIAKSLVFERRESKRAVLVITSGANRVDEARLRDILSESISMADPDFVRDQTGFAIGGVPPLGHPHPLEVFIDEDLMQYSDIWAAAGTPRAVFRLTPDQLLKITRGKVIAVK
jgi:prolyl-tRNA editing enzyme YbaK/EbsC (Cys-tRNA(Pro) deacylase)